MNQVKRDTQSLASNRGIEIEKCFSGDLDKSFAVLFKILSFKPPVQDTALSPTNHMTEIPDEQFILNCLNEA
jgi:hypothetical protein